jgi:hypothetical protein
MIRRFAMENLDRDKMESDQNIDQSESWSSESSPKSGSSESSLGSKRELDESEDIDNPSCEGCYY